MFSDGRTQRLGARGQVANVHSCLPCLLFILVHAGRGDHERSEVAPFFPLRMVARYFDRMVRAFRSSTMSCLFRGVRVVLNVGEVGIQCLLEHLLEVRMQSRLVVFDGDTRGRSQRPFLRVQVLPA